MRAVRLLFIVLTVSLLVTSCTKTKYEYYPNGLLKSETQYRNGKEHGITKYFNKNYGTVIMEAYMVRGQKHGSFKRFYFNGNIEYEANYNYDVLDGIERNYTQQGQMISETTYKNGVKEGPHSTWYENGVLLSKGAYKNDLQEGEWLFYDERGFLMGEAHFTEGSGEQIAYDHNGVKARVTTYSKGVKEGPETYYNPDGTVEKVVQFHEDRIVSTTETSEE